MATLFVSEPLPSWIYWLVWGFSLYYFFLYRWLCAQSNLEGFSTCHAIQLRQRCDIERVSALTILVLSQATAKKLESRTDHSEASLTFLAIKAENTNFSLAFWVRAEDEPVTLVSVHHVRQLGREDVVTAIFTLFLPCYWVYVLDRQVAIQSLWVELTLCRLTPLEVNNCSHFTLLLI